MSEQFGTVIEDDDDTNIDSEKELSLEQKLEIAITKKTSTNQNTIQKSVIFKTIRQEIDLFENERFRGKYLGKVYRALLTVPPTSVDAEEAFSTAAYRWVSRNASQSMPETAITGGRDVDGSTIYVGRAFHEGDMLPAKVIPDKNVAYVCHNGEEHPKDDFEVLCQGEFAWEFCSNGSVPSEAVIAGQTSDGEPLYVGRVLHNGSQTIGKIQQSHGCLYIPFDGEELSFKDYEVLVLH